VVSIVTRRAVQRPGAWAVLSDCGRYRYALGRDTGVLGAEGTVLFVMLNPSTANGVDNDPTIRRCIRFAATWGFAHLTVANAYALRSTDPRCLWHASDPVGPDNDRWLRQLSGADQAIAAWGTHIRPDREQRVLDLLGLSPTPVHCLGVTRDGHPRHPLYLDATTPRRRYPIDQEGS
jgi:hypothetical protein